MIMNTPGSKNKASSSPFQPCRPTQMPMQTVLIQMRRLQAVSSGSKLFAILLLIFDPNPYLQKWVCPNSDMEEPISEIQGRKC